MVFIFQLVCLLFLALAPAASQAADPATFKPQVEIPGMKKEFGAPDKTGGYAIPGSTASIAKYIRVIYKYAIGIVGILAAVVLMIGGVIWITAGGNAERIGEAKAWIASSLTGLLLALLSYTILATVNPALVNFQVSGIKTVEKIPDKTAIDEHLLKNPKAKDCINSGGKPIGLTMGNDYNSGSSSCKTQCKSVDITGYTYFYNNAWFFCCKCNKPIPDTNCKNDYDECWSSGKLGYCKSGICHLIKPIK